MSAIVYRSVQNPLISPADVIPSAKNLKVVGVFNCGVAKYKGETLLLCRVAEKAINSESEGVVTPVVKQLDGHEQIMLNRWVQKEGAPLDLEDSRYIMRRIAGKKIIIGLTSLSHLRVARSKDGVHFVIDSAPAIVPTAATECWGMEDPRITQIGDVYYTTYTSVTSNGAAVSMMKTSDFVNYQRIGVIYLPENKDVVLFPEQIGGMYYALCRPVPNSFGEPDIWLSTSPDLQHWGGYKHLCGVSENGWEEGRVGGGAVPIKTQYGWLVVYHAADRNNRYCLGAMLLDLYNPGLILARSQTPLMEPVTPYEQSGFFSNVVFTCGCLLQDETLIIYYGAADETVCRADIQLKEVLRHLGVLD